LDITFHCDHCGQALTIDEAEAGASVKCPKCAARLTAPRELGIKQIHFACGNCGQELSVVEAGAGMVGKCPKCNQPLTVPGPSTPSPKAARGDIKFFCEKCGQHLVIDEAGAGLTIQCPKCGVGLTVPKPIRSGGCPNLPPPPQRVPSQSSAGEADLPSVTHLVESFIPGEPSRFRLDFKGQSSEYEVPASQPMESYQDDIEALNFHGSFRDSLSGNYSVAWGTRNPTGGYDTEYLLLHQGSILARGKRTNIQDAVVADNGTFLIHDCTVSLQNVVTLFDVTGRKLKQMKPYSVYEMTFDLEKKLANVEILSAQEGRPAKRLTFSLLDGSVEVVKLAGLAAWIPEG
jgi:phage FluMu protein Com